MKKLKIGLAAFALIAFAGIVSAQQGLWSNFPIVGGAAYCSSTTNSVCTNTVPAGPTVITGNETIPANTNLSQGRNPQNVLLKPANLNALPITWVTVTSSSPTAISASNIQGGVFYVATGTITSANVTLPLGAIDGQQFVLSANRTITTLTISAPAGDTLGTSAGPTVLTASTTGSYGYRWVYRLSTKFWHRLQ